MKRGSNRSKPKIGLIIGIIIVLVSYYILKLFWSGELKIFENTYLYYSAFCGLVIGALFIAAFVKRLLEDLFGITIYS